MIGNKTNILIISESKLDDTSLTSQFSIDNFTELLRLDGVAYYFILKITWQQYC